MNLTPKQKVFADAVLRGSTGSAAARLAGCRGSIQYVGRRAQKWRHHPKVAAYIAAGQEPVGEKAIITATREKSIERLWEIVNGDDEGPNRVPARVRLRACQIIIKSMGWDKPPKEPKPVVQPTEY